jgi:hypothetical protein
MKTAEFVALEKRLLSDFPKFVIKGNLMFVAPVKYALRGFYFEPSGFDKEAFYVNVFFTVLCVPTEHLSFTFCDRIRTPNGSDGWHANQGSLETSLKLAMQSQNMPILSEIESRRNLAELVALMVGNSKDPNRSEALAYALALAGETAAAIEGLDQLLTLLDSEIGWQQEIMARALLLRSNLAEKPSEAKEQLEEWEAETVRNLGLERFCAV